MFHFPFHTVDLYIKSEPVLVDRTTYKKRIGCKLLPVHLLNQLHKTDRIEIKYTSDIFSCHTWHRISRDHQCIPYIA